jgi:Mor family transcriptional regulator
MSKQKFSRNKRIVELFKNGKWSYKKLAKEFKLSYSRICLIMIRFVKKEDREEIFFDNHKWLK